MGVQDIRDNREREHEIVLKQRREMSVRGVTDIDSFDESGAVLKTTGGELTVEGSELKIGTLDIDRGVVSITGRISAIFYSDDRVEEKKGILSRFFK